MRESIRFPADRVSSFARADFDLLEASAGAGSCDVVVVADEVGRTSRGASPRRDRQREKSGNGDEVKALRRMLMTTSYEKSDGLN